MTFYALGQAITVDVLETALDRLAVIMSEATDEGVTYLPIWHRLERELQDLRNQNDALAGVRARLAKLSPGQKAKRSAADFPAAT
jgi:hypothetical protein